MKIITTITAFLLAVLMINQTHACSTFLLKDEKGNPFFGRNFDFPVGMGHIHINLKGMEKTSFQMVGEQPFTWVSEYGSISFNQNGREFPYGGMNEAGLVIEQMWHQEARYPEPDHRYGLTELQWIQYQLDNSATVDEVLRTDQVIRISNASIATLHFLVADETGNVAVIEFINGQMSVRSSAELVHPVLTNCSYDVSINYMASKESNLQQEFAPWTENSSGRFLTAANMLEEYQKNPTAPLPFSFDVLDRVSQIPGTVWSIVYDISNRNIYYKTQANKQVKKLEMEQFSFDCHNPWLMGDINDQTNGPSGFQSFSTNANFEMIDNVCNGVEFLKNIPQEFRTHTARYPETLSCKN
jgi:choloylglycine hydrolase